jgi:hypothetical protein
MQNKVIKPVKQKYDGFFIALIQGCSSIPLQSEELVESKAGEFLRPQELTQISLNTQRSALQWHSGG